MPPDIFADYMSIGNLFIEASGLTEVLQGKGTYAGAPTTVTPAGTYTNVLPWAKAAPLSARNAAWLLRPPLSPSASRTRSG